MEKFLLSSKTQPPHNQSEDSMDTKKVISQLIKIAESQQKIINKLAQELQPAGEPTGAEHFDPNKAQKQAARAIIDALPPGFFQQKLVNIEERGNDMVVGFKPGQKTQPNYNVVLETMQKLTDSGALTRAYSLKAV